MSREPRQRAASILCRYGAALRGSGNCGGFARPGGYRGAPPVVRWAGEKGRERLLSAARGLKLRRRAGPRRVEALRGGVRSRGGRAGGTRCSRAHLGERQRPGSARGPARSLHASATTAVRCWLRGFLLQLQSGAEFAKHLNRAASRGRALCSPRGAERRLPALPWLYRSRSPCEVLRAAPRGSDRAALGELCAAGSGAAALPLFRSVAA